MKPTSVKTVLFALYFALLQVLIPPGMMPTAQAEGVEIVICTGQGMQTLRVDENGQPIDQDQSQPDYSFCYYGLKVYTAENDLLFSHAFVPSEAPHKLRQRNENCRLCSPLQSSYRPRDPPSILS